MLGVDWIRGEVGLRAACTEVRPSQGPMGIWRGTGEGGSLGACPRVLLGVKGSGWAGHTLRSQVRLWPWGWGSELGCFGGKQSGWNREEGSGTPEVRSAWTLLTKALGHVLQTPGRRWAGVSAAETWG